MSLISKLLDGYLTQLLLQSSLVAMKNKHKKNNHAHSVAQEDGAMLLFSIVYCTSPPLSYQMYIVAIYVFLILER